MEKQQKMLEAAGKKPLSSELSKEDRVELMDTSESILSRTEGPDKVCVHLSICVWV
jgi:hypothetical protein